MVFISVSKVKAKKKSSFGTSMPQSEGACFPENTGFDVSVSFPFLFRNKLVSNPH